MNRYVKIAGGLVGVVGIGIAGAAAWATTARNTVLATTYEAHAVDVPLPFPLSAQEIEAIREERRASIAATLPPEAADPGELPDPLEGVDLDAIALERAIARGRHLVDARYACGACHGADFGGGTMVDSPVIGSFLGRNLTLGQGGVTAAYTMADWDRKVRHGINPDGTSGPMPSEDYWTMSDRELSDIVAYIRSKPPVDADIPKPAYGPLFTVLIAAGEVQLSAARLHDHSAPHAAEPPAAEDTLAFGKHLSGVCTGCHRHDLTGGPIKGGDPAWAPAANLTPHESGLTGWTFEGFDKTMRTGERPNGAQVLSPMTEAMPIAKNMTETEMRALWAYLQTLEPKPTGQ